MDPWTVRALRRAAIVACLAICSSSLPAGAQSPEAIVPRTALVLARPGRSGRDALPRDAVQALIVTGAWKTPSAGDTVTLPDGSVRTWTEIRADQNGRFAGGNLAGGYAFIAVQSPASRTMILEAAGHSMVYVNGEPRTGDPYRYGYVRLPVKLRAGQNELLFAVSRPELDVRLTSPPGPYALNTGDMTLPDLVPGASGAYHAAVVVVNAAETALDGGAIEAVIGKGRAVRSAIPRVPALGVRKVGFRLPSLPRDRGKQERETGVKLRLIVNRRAVAEAEIKVGVRMASDTRKCTFISAVDGSVQYYAVVPPRADAEPPAMVYPAPIGGWRSFDFRNNPVTLLSTAYSVVRQADRYERELRAQARPPGLVLTCHGAGVEAIGQAASYAPKRGLWIVAPTNRRPFGFDWEEWGRMDALEVLDLAQQTLRTDPARTYLTGHSMGGHGTWHLGVTFPDRFAAIAPSAGWVSFQSYAGGARYEGGDPVEAILRRATAGSDTLTLAPNLKPLGVYILHGDADDNVPVTEARAMHTRLKEFHNDVTLHEQPGAGHWWGAPSDPGTGCVDWPAMFDLFQRRIIARADETRHVDFVTMNPGVSSRMRWLTILQQQRSLAPSSASIRCDPVGRRFVGTTENVASLALDTSPFGPGATVSVELDGTKLEVPLAERVTQITLRREPSGWRIGEALSAAQKSPGRAGPFKEAFANRFVLVYGTGGSPEENAWSAARARYDAETFWYRGNGSPEMIADTEFDAARYRDRNVIVYGHREMNRVWSVLLADAPVQVTRGSVRVGDRTMTGGDLACVFCYPRPDSRSASVGVVAGTDLTGMRLTDRAPYFVSGTGFPDLLVWTPETLARGAGGVRAAGSFGNDWSVTGGDIVFVP
ncbi:MAG: prolyl oligopeptidase family serine peptidase [Chthonomonadales bacterium]|nr:prolyl oligopeptidase family serine peptidase [Chthonomonadales bacterium]